MTEDEHKDERNPRGGRPPKLATDRREDKIELRLTTAEKIAFRDKAAASGKTVSDWLRDLGNGHTPRAPATAIDMALISELNRIGNNVNQLAKATHRGQDFRLYWKHLGDELHRAVEKASAKI